MLMDSRSDDSVLGFFLKWFATFLMNFTIGLVTSFITFVFMVGWSLGPSIGGYLTRSIGSRSHSLLPPHTQVYHVVFSYSPDPLSGTPHAPPPRRPHAASHSAG
jgi:hypothetical protein